MTGIKSLIASIAFLILVASGLIAAGGSIQNGIDNGWLFIVCGIINVACAGLSGFYAWDYIYNKWKEKEEAKKKEAK